MAYKNIQIKRALLFVAFVILMTIWLLILGFHKDPYIQSTLGALSVASSENEYFISVSGNDTNTGSIDSPFLTLSHALDYANPGDTVWVRGGDFKSHSYAGKVTISGKNGTEANPILVKAYNNEVPIFEYIKIQNSSWLELKGLTIIGAKTLPQEFQQIDHIYADDESVGIILGQENATTRQQKCAQKFPSYLDTVDYWLNNWSAGISIHTSHDILVSDNDVSYHSAGVQVREESDSVIVVNNEIHNNLNGVYTWKNTGDVYSSDDLLISNNHIFYNLKFGIFLMRYAQNTKVEDNLIEYNALTHIGINNGSNNSYIYNNRLKFGGYYSECMDYPGASAISVADGGTGNIIDSNIISDQIDYSANDGNGIISDYTTAGITAINNVVYDNMGSGFSSTHSGNNIILNNTFANNGYGSSAPRYGIRMSDTEDANNVIANNIIYKNANGGILLNNGLISQQEYIDYNLYYQPNKPIMLGSSVDANQQYTDFSQYKNGVAKDLGIDQHSLSADPKFVNEVAKDFSLSTSSSAIDAGTNTYTSINNKNINNVYDIGAIENLSTPNNNNNNGTSGQGAQSAICKGDYNNDDKIDENDFETFAKNYKKNDLDCTLDLSNDDCYLNIIDFVIFADSYSKQIECNF